MGLWRLLNHNFKVPRARMPGLGIVEKVNLASLVWAKLILGRFRDAVLPDFSRFPDGSDD